MTFVPPFAMYCSSQAQLRILQCVARVAFFFGQAMNTAGSEQSLRPAISYTSLNQSPAQVATEAKGLGTAKMPTLTREICPTVNCGGQITFPLVLSLNVYQLASG